MRPGLWILGLLLLAGALVVAVLAASRARQDGGSGAGLDLDWRLGTPGRVAVLPLDGEITDSTGADLTRRLRQFGEQVAGVKAIIISMDTPGGGVAASQEVCQEVSRLRRNGIKVVAAMGGMAASGGYYVASACDEIVADPGTVTGSIGVIMESFDVHALMARIGVRSEVVKSGEFKDAGSPFRAMTGRERRYFQGTVMDVYDQFVTDVAHARRGALARALARRDGRPASSYSDAEIKAYVKSLADGRIYTGRQAYNLGLVDCLGGLQDAIAKAGDLAGLKNPEVVTWRRPESLAEQFTGMNRTEWAAWARETLTGEAPRLSFLLR